MKRRRSRDHFDLLPFIAIMMCLLGCLLLVTISMASINVGAGAAEQWVPGGSEEGPGKTPVLVEWDGSRLTVHQPSSDGLSTIPGRGLAWTSLSALIDAAVKSKPKGEGGKDPDITSDELDALKREQEEANKEFSGYLADLAKLKDTHYALFAVRPSGFDNFRELSAHFRESGINIGYEPLNNGGKPVALRLPATPAQPNKK